MNEYTHRKFNKYIIVPFDRSLSVNSDFIRH